ncbi:MAG: sulfatase-like hydrolase/transferase [Acidimicrobiales bacterium]
MGRDGLGDRPPDIILFITDQQRFDQVGYASAGHFETPNVDGLAARGVAFDGAYSASTVCVPSRVSMLTGIQPHRHPTQENEFALREGFWTVARELRAHGYETAAIGKMHFAPVHADHGFDTVRLCEHIHSQGLGELSIARGDTMDDYHDWLIEQGLDDHRLSGPPGDQPAVRGVFASPAAAHPTAWVEREVVTFLDDRDRGRPLFLVVSFPHPHAPYDPPEPYASMYDRADSLLPEDGMAANAHLPMVFVLATHASPTRGEAERPESVARFLATVRGLIKQIDDVVGRVLAQVDLDSTVVLFTSDHGDFAGHRGLMRKMPWVPFDDLARVAFVAAGPRIQRGQRIADLVQTSDIPLTLLDLAGVPPPEGLAFDSRSLLPLLEGRPGPADLDRDVFSAISMGWPMVRRGQFKLIGHVERPGRVLFDLERDPHEQVNLLPDPELAQVSEDLAARLEAMCRQPTLS